MQSNLSHNKFIDRFRVGIFLNYSPMHTSSAPLELNTYTTCVIPQFNCVYDDDFSICKKEEKFRPYRQYKAKVKEDKQSNIDLLTNNFNDSIPFPQNFESPKIDLQILFKPSLVPIEKTLYKNTYTY